MRRRQKNGAGQEGLSTADEDESEKRHRCRNRQSRFRFIFFAFFLSMLLIMRPFSTCGLNYLEVNQVDENKIQNKDEKKTKDLIAREKKVKRAGYCSQDPEAGPRVADHFGVRLSCMVVRPLF